MELKHATHILRLSAFCLLIVPYGIETLFAIDCSTICLLLIVPYGIETSSISSDRKVFLLLIVPYGIETTSLSLFSLLLQSFNRTLWN